MNALTLRPPIDYVTLSRIDRESCLRELPPPRRGLAFWRRADGTSSTSARSPAATDRGGLGEWL